MRARKNLRMLTAATVVSAVLSVLTPTVAYADGTTALPNGLGSGSASTGLPTGALGTNPGVDLAASGYSLAQVDPSTNTMTMGQVGSALTPDYAVTAELAETGALAIDAAEMAKSARLAEEARRAAQAAQAAKNAQAGAASLKAGTVPAPYDSMIVQAVANYCPQLPPGLLAAQLEAESGFNPKAQSGAGAKGIAQFMDATWATYGVDGNGDGIRNVLDPADAIPAAARYDCAVRDAVRKVPGDTDANMLAAYNAGPGAVLTHHGVPPFAETRAYVSKILARAEYFTDAAAGSAGAAGTSAGCPTTAPAGTLRDSAASLGISRICADSVAEAASPQAARAIKYALRNLGAPYSQASRMSEGYYDCSSFVMRAYAAAGSPVISGGWAPNTYAIETASFAQRINFTDRRPGDLVYPFQGHISMSLAHGLKVHTNRPGDVSHVNAMYTSAYLTVRIRV